MSVNADKEELKQVEEYRLAPSDSRLPACYRGVLSKSLAQAGRNLSAHRGLNHRIQSRTVTTSPWKDVPSV